MAGISGLSSGIDYSTLFGTSGSSSSGTDYSSILNIDLADMASVRNGSYGKLLKNYYAKSKAESKSEVGDTDEELTKIKSNADKLVKAADALNDSKLYETKTVTDENGRSSEEFVNKDKLASAVKDFVSAYNSTIDSAADSETKSVLRNGSWLAGMTKQNVNLLNEIGISVGSDDKLSFDEEKFKSADAGTVKDVLSGTGSYASQVSAKASSISRATQTAGALYTSSGSYSTSTQASSFTQSIVDKLTGADKEEEEEEDAVAKLLSEAENPVKKILSESTD